MTRLPLALGLVLGLGLAPLALRAARAEVNTPAPLLQAKEWVGPPVEWARERGKVIVLLFVQPRQQASDMALKDQADALKRRGKDGLDAVLVSDQAKADVDLWARTVVRGQSWRIAIEENGKISIQFMAQATPFCVVVDRDGRDVFEGDAIKERVFIAKAVDDALDRPMTVVRDATSPRLRPAWIAMDKKDWKAALKTLVEVRDDAAATPEETRDARGMILMCAGAAKKAQKDALALHSKDEFYEEVLALEQAADTFAGTIPAEEMKKAAADLRADKKLKNELAAGEELHKALEAPDPTSKLKALIANSKYKGLKALEHAKKKLDELKPGGK